MLKSKVYDQTYVGSTKDLIKRVRDHNDGKEISTKRYKPWQLLYYEAYLTERLARMREKRLKYNGNGLRELKKRIGLMKSGAGFTLVELLVAVAMLGILGAIIIAIINPLGQLGKARDAQRKQDLRQIQLALDAYYNDKNSYPIATADGQITGGLWGTAWLPYLAKVPKDPSSPSQNYLYQSDDGTWYRLFAKLEYCPDAQTIPGIDCANAPYNFSVVSSNISVTAFEGVSPSPTPTVTPPVATAIPPPWCTPCAADVNRDGSVNNLDFSTVISCFGQSAPFTASCSNADLNGDDTVDIQDQSCTVSQLGQQCPAHITPVP